MMLNYLKDLKELLRTNPPEPRRSRLLIQIDNVSKALNTDLVTVGYKVSDKEYNAEDYDTKTTI